MAITNFLKFYASSRIMVKIIKIPLKSESKNSNKPQKLSCRNIIEIIGIIFFASYVYYFQNKFTASIIGAIIFLIFFAAMEYNTIKESLKKKLLNSDSKSSKKFDYYFFIFYIISVMTILFLLSIIILTLQILMPLLVFNIGPTVIVLILSIIMMAMYLFLLIAPFYLYHKIITLFNKKNKFKVWFVITLALMISFIVIGSLFLATIFTPQTYVILTVTANNQSAKLLCGIDNTPLIAENFIDCGQPTDNVKNISSINITYYLRDNSIITRNFNQQRITIPEKTARMDISIYLNSENNTITQLNGSTNIAIPTYSEREEQKKTFLTFLLGLFAVMFITIPLVIKQLRDLFNE